MRHFSIPSVQDEGKARLLVASVWILIPVAAVLLVPHHTHAQALDIRGAGCIGPCHGVACCGKMVVVNKNGIGFGRNFDCRTYLRSASADQQRAFRSLLREQGATCPEIAPLCEECKTDLDNACTLLGQTVEKINNAAEAVGDLNLEASDRAKLNSKLKQELLSNDLPAIRKALCGHKDKGVSKKLDETVEFVKKSDPSGKVATEFYKHVFDGKTILEDLQKKLGCPASTPTPPPTPPPTPTPCKSGEKPSGPLTSFLEDQAKQAGGIAGEAIDPDLGPKAQNVLKVLDALKRIPKASCVPEDIYRQFQLCQRTQTLQDCQDLCLKTSRWMQDVAPNLGTAIHTFLLDCVAATPSVP